MSVPRRRPSVAALRRGAAAFERELAAWEETQRLQRAAVAFERELAAWQAERRALRERERKLEEREQALKARERAVKARERELEERERTIERRVRRLAPSPTERPGRAAAHPGTPRAAPLPRPREVSEAKEEELEQQPLPTERPGHAAPPDMSRAAPLPESKPREVSEAELEELYEAIAEQWGVPVDVAEQAVSGGVVGTQEELVDYLEELHDLLDNLGYDIDVSDLWDMYYGYTPGSHGGS
jgi:hypothetical protein